MYHTVLGTVAALSAGFVYLAIVGPLLFSRDPKTIAAVVITTAIIVMGMYDK